MTQLRAYRGVDTREVRRMGIHVGSSGVDTGLVGCGHGTRRVWTQRSSVVGSEDS